MRYVGCYGGSRDGLRDGGGGVGRGWGVLWAGGQGPGAEKSSKRLRNRGKGACDGVGGGLGPRRGFWTLF